MYKIMSAFHKKDVGGKFEFYWDFSFCIQWSWGDASPPDKRRLSRFDSAENIALYTQESLRIDKLKITKDTLWILFCREEECTLYKRKTGLTRVKRNIMFQIVTQT